MPNIKVVTGSTTGTAYTPKQLAALFPLNGFNLLASHLRGVY
jgi:hypothetical protein